MKKPLLVACVALLLFTILTVDAHAITVDLAPYLPIPLSSQTALQSSQPLILSGISLGSNSLVLDGVYMGSGSTIYSLNVSSVDANLTLNQLSAAGETSITAQGSGLTPVILQGFGKAPDSVSTIDNQTVPYRYTSSNDTLVLNPTVSGSTTILIDYPQSSLDMSIAIAVIALVIGSSVGFTALVLTLRRRKENEMV